jgi:hypothetical protein
MAKRPNHLGVHREMLPVPLLDQIPVAFGTINVVDRLRRSFVYQLQTNVRPPAAGSTGQRGAISGRLIGYARIVRVASSVGA